MEMTRLEVEIFNAHEIFEANFTDERDFKILNCLKKP